MKIFLKIIVWILTGIVTLILGVVIFLGPLAKYVIEHNSEKYTGRVVRMEKLKINIFTGRVNVYTLKVYEKDKKTLFFGFDHLFTDVDERKLLKSVYHIEHILLENPVIRVVQKGNTFSFDDILRHFSPDKKKPKTLADTLPAQYFLEDIKITGGKVTYINKDYTLDAQLLKLSLRVPRVAWNDDEISVDYSFLLRTGGVFNGGLKLNINSLNFEHKVRMDNFNLAVLYPYLTPYMKIADFEGLLSMDVTTLGNFNDPQAIAVRGTTGIYRFLITDEKGKKVTGMKLLTVALDSLNIKQNIWRFGTILADGPYFRYERYLDGDNLSQLMMPLPEAHQGTGTPGKDSSSAVASRFNPFVLLADYVKTLAGEVIITSYKVKRFSITDGMVDFKDHTLDEEFSLNLNKIYVDVQQLNSAKGRATVDFSTGINRDGFMMADISVNPMDLMDFEIKYEMKNVAVIDYNPYSLFHIAYPFKEGKLNYTGIVTVKNHQIKMDNKLFVEKIYVGKKVKKQDALHLPVKLALAIMRDKDGNINLVVPVEGDLDDPKFKWWKIVGQVLKNMIVKAATAPANFFASAFGGNENDYKEIRFDYEQRSLTEKQVKQLEHLTKSMLEKPELVLEFKQTLDTAKDMEYLAYYEAKKRYYFEMMKLRPVPDSLSTDDINAIYNIGTTDLQFQDYLDRKLSIPDPATSTREKCILFVGLAQLTAVQKERMEKRNQSLEYYLVHDLSFPSGRIKITNDTDPSRIPDDKIPRYLIEYTVPE